MARADDAMPATATNTKFSETSHHRPAAASQAAASRAAAGDAHEQPPGSGGGNGSGVGSGTGEGASSAGGAGDHLQYGQQSSANKGVRPLASRKVPPLDETGGWFSFLGLNHQLLKSVPVPPLVLHYLGLFKPPHAKRSLPFLALPLALFLLLLWLVVRSQTGSVGGGGGRWGRRIAISSSTSNGRSLGGSDRRRPVVIASSSLSPLSSTSSSFLSPPSLAFPRLGLVDGQGHVIELVAGEGADEDKELQKRLKRAKIVMSSAPGGGSVEGAKAVSSEAGSRREGAEEEEDQQEGDEMAPTPPISPDQGGPAVAAAAASASAVGGDVRSGGGGGGGVRRPGGAADLAQHEVVVLRDDNDAREDEGLLSRQQRSRLKSLSLGLAIGGSVVRGKGGEGGTGDGSDGRAKFMLDSDGDGEEDGDAEEEDDDEEERVKLKQGAREEGVNAEGLSRNGIVEGSNGRKEITVVGADGQHAAKQPMEDSVGKDERSDKPQAVPTKVGAEEEAEEGVQTEAETAVIVSLGEGSSRNETKAGAGDMSAGNVSGGGGGDVSADAAAVALSQASVAGSGALAPAPAQNAAATVSAGVSATGPEGLGGGQGLESAGQPVAARRRGKGWNRRPILDPAVDSPMDCDIFHGAWVRDDANYPLYTNNSCAYISQHQNCQGNGRPDSAYEHYRWQPSGCRLPRFDAHEFLRVMRRRSILFVGDSVARNQMESLLCLLSQAETPTFHGSKRMIRYIFRSARVAVARIWSAWLVDETNGPLNPATATSGNDESGSQNVTRLHLDRPQEAWLDEARHFDVVVVCSGHWFVKPSVYVVGGQDVGSQLLKDRSSLPENASLSSTDAFRISVDTVFRAVATLPGFRGTFIYRTYSPDHYEGGRWDTGGSCAGKEEPKPAGAGWENAYGTEIYRHQRKVFAEVFAAAANRSSSGSSSSSSSSEEDLAKGLVLEGPDSMRGGGGATVRGRMRLRQKSRRFALLDIMPMAMMRVDGHPGPYRGKKSVEELVAWRKKSKYPPPQDCLHWCLPGPVDVWNELLLQLIKRSLS